MLSRRARLEAIRGIVGARRIRTQQELRQALRREGFDVDQATISRDMRELGIVRIPEPAGGFRYGIVGEPARLPGVRLVGRFIRSIAASGNLLVIRTETGTAPTVGEAVDRLGWPEILGTVAGDNTLLAVLRPGSSGARVARRLRRTFHGEAA